MTEDASRYQGTELQLFAEAHRWKHYVRAQLAPHLRGEVLEVGAGIGSTTRILRTTSVAAWTALEPDAELSRLAAVEAEHSPGTAEVDHIVGTLADLQPVPSFDTIVYVDVLEHIADDH